MSAGNDLNDVLSVLGPADVDSCMKANSTVSEKRGSMLEKWAQLLSLLSAQAGIAPEPTVAATRGRIAKLHEEAEEDCIFLPAPGFDDPVFAGMGFGNERAKAVADYRSSEAKREALRARWRRNRVAGRERINRLLGRDTKHRNNPPGPNKCACGCGRQVSKTFAVGHGAMYLNWMRRIERGMMPRECLPAVLQETIRWTRCKRCGGFIPVKDAYGNALVSKIGYECKLRLRRLKARKLPMGFGEADSGKHPGVNVTMRGGGVVDERT